MKRAALVLLVAVIGCNGGEDMVPLADAANHVSAEVIDDARAAASLMGMNNVYYRFRHFMGESEYKTMRANLRMHRVGKPLADYMSEKVWQPAGMECDAFYTVESEGGQEIGGSRAGMVLREIGRAHV